MNYNAGVGFLPKKYTQTYISLKKKHDIFPNAANTWQKCEQKSIRSFSIFAISLEFLASFLQEMTFRNEDIYSC